MFLALDAEETGGTEFVEDTAPEAVEEAVEQAEEQAAPVTSEVESEYIEAEDDVPEPEEHTEVAAETSPIDESLSATWKEMGYPEEMLGQFSSNEELRRAMAAQDAMVLAASRQRRTQAAPQQPPATPGPDPTKAEGQTPAKMFEKLNLNLEGWDEEAVKAITAINDHYGSALEKLEAELRQRDERYSVLENVHVSQAQAAQQQQIAQDNHDIDKWFTNLDEGYAETFGVGDYSKLKPDSAELTSRMELVREAEILQQVDAQLGRPPQKWTALLERALHSRQPEKVKELARKEIAQQVQKRRSQNIARPSSRNGKPSSGIDKAIERNRNFWKRAGHTVPESDGDNASESLL